MKSKEFLAKQATAGRAASAVENQMLKQSLNFLHNHKEIALATCQGNLPKLRIFQVMKQEGHVLYFATSANKFAIKREESQTCLRSALSLCSAKNSPEREQTRPEVKAVYHELRQNPNVEILAYEGRSAEGRSYLATASYVFSQSNYSAIVHAAVIRA